MENEQNNKLSELCNNLDELTLKQVDLLDEQLILMSKLGSVLTGAFIDLAKSRYIRGENSVSTMQIPGEESTVHAATLVTRDSDCKLVISKNQEVNDPIKWFGVLVPNSLKQSQKAFQKVLEIAIEIINVRYEWLKSLEEYKVQNTIKSSSS